MSDEKKLNYDIYNKRITLIDENGEFKGVVSRDEGISQARDLGLDLVQFSVGSETFPVCKIIDYGKYKYHQSKKDKKNSHNVVIIKEVRIGHGISDHDLETKHRLVHKFLDKKYKVKYTLKLKGCPMPHQAQAKIKFRENANAFADKADFGKEEPGDKMFSIVLTPKT